MAEYLSPGVYVEEFESGGKPMEGVSTSTAGFIGLAERGPVEGVPQLVTNFSDFKRIYGGYLSESEFGEYRFLAYAVEHFFINGGSRCFVSRVAPGDAKCAEGFAPAQEGAALIFTAKNPGLWGDNIRVTISPASKAKTQILEIRDTPTGKQYLVKNGAGFNAGDVVAYRTAMEDIVRNTYQQSIYLAKIALIKAGPSYYIESVENMPFRQYVFNGSLSAAMNDITLAELERLRTQSGASAPSALAPRAPAAPRNVSSGSVVINLGIGGTEGQRFFSPPLSHGLGLGSVHVGLGMGWNINDDAPVICGSQEIFDEEGGEVHAELAAKVDVTTGTFVIGLRLIAPTSARHVRVHWTAVRDSRESIHDREQRRLFIRPDVCELEVRETRYFQAVFENVSDQRVRWSVQEPQGGEIDENGMYTAPNTVGVYEIVAESAAHPELRASTYVVVRDPLQEEG